MSLLDSTVLFSFDRSGYERHAKRFDPHALDVDLEGRVCLVTGANSGIGFATARALAERHARVYLLVRSIERGQQARERILAAAGSADVRVERVDVSSCESLRRFADELREEKVHVLVNNAGVLPAERRESVDGIELTFATNVLGPHLMTKLLVPRLSAAEDARVINVSSGGMYPKRLDLRDWEWKERPFDGVQAYAFTKRAEVVLTELWAERLRSAGVSVSSMHPGWAETPAVQSSLPRFFSLMRGRLRTPEQGADTVVWLAVSRAAAGRTGLFFFDREPQGTYPLPFTREKPAEREALWQLCERLAEKA